MYHLIAFLLGAVGIVADFLYKMSHAYGVPGAAVTIAGPVITVVSMVGFGILCGISLCVFLLVCYSRKN